MDFFTKLIKSIYYKMISANKVAKLEGVKFGKNCFFRTKQFGSEPYLIEIGDYFKTAGNVQFITHDGGVHVLRNLYPDLQEVDSFAKIRIDNNVFIGYGVIVLPGSQIGSNIIIGAGSVVRGKLNDNSIYAGIPAKFICTIEEYKNKNKNKFLNTKNMIDLDKKNFIIKEII